MCRKRIRRAKYALAKLYKQYTVLLSEILFILFTFHFFTKWHTAETAKCNHRM